MLDYQTQVGDWLEIHPLNLVRIFFQQYRLLPQLVRVFAMFLAGSYIREMYNKVIGNVIAVGDVIDT